MGNIKIIIICKPFNVESHKTHYMRAGRWFYLALILVILGGIFLSGCLGRETVEQKEELSVPPPTTQVVEEQVIPPLEKPREEIKPEKTIAWEYGGVAISGRYADAEVIRLEEGKYRMYYSPEPEVSGFEGQVYSAISDDGVNWVQEEGVRMKWATFPSVIAVPTGYRMYYQNRGVIRSAISRDGITWNEEPGIRVDTINDAGLKLDNVASPTVVRIDDEYLMVYRGTINQRYSADVPNENTQLFFWATSKDGLNFVHRGIALDSRNREFKGFLDGPELVIWDDGSVRLYFWSYKGIYHTIFDGNEFSKEVKFDYTTSPKGASFPQNPPSDPTLVKINNTWFMYYGQHTMGIHYATLRLR